MPFVIHLEQNMFSVMTHFLILLYSFSDSLSILGCISEGSLKIMYADHSKPDLVHPSF